MAGTSGASKAPIVDQATAACLALIEPWHGRSDAAGELCPAAKLPGMDPAIALAIIGLVVVLVVALLRPMTIHARDITIRQEARVTVSRRRTPRTR